MTIDLLNKLHEVSAELQQIIACASVPHNIEQEELEAVRKGLDYIVKAESELAPYCMVPESGRN
jgi:hypothetical protein